MDNKELNEAKQRALKIALKNVKKCLLNGSKKVTITKSGEGGYLILSEINKPTPNEQETN